jgi:N-acetylneuraminic acid mutarotase
MRKEMDDLARRLNVVQNDVRDVKDDVRDVKDDVRDVKEKVEHVELTQEEMAYLTKEATERCNLFTGQQKIFVCGGHDGKTIINSVESYNWPENSWTLEPAMKEARSSPSAFVHGREIYVSGGIIGTKNTDNIESFNVDEWVKSPVKMPFESNGHKMVCHENSAILTGGRDGDNFSDGIHEISLNPPHDTKLLTQMPEQRCYHSCEMLDNQVIVAGGRTSRYIKDAKNTVYAYDLNNNECKTLPPLPSPITDMASVSYKGNVILIGGVNERFQTLNSVVMYDVKTGKIKMLPCLNHKRAGSAAVIAGNVIIVMGGYDHETETYLSSVECLDLSSNVWRELSPMTTKRGGATAVMKPLS